MRQHNVHTDFSSNRAYKRMWRWYFYNDDSVLRCWGKISEFESKYTIFIPENNFENAACKMAAICLGLRVLNDEYLTYWDPNKISTIL